MNEIAQYLLHESWTGLCMLDLIIIAYVYSCFKSNSRE
jgi:hypothetical protein